MRTNPSSPGFSLIEMLVAVLIISFGLLGLLGLQSRALTLSVGTEDGQRAAMLAAEMAAKLVNANSTGVSLDTVITPWAERVADPTKGGLPSGVGTVTIISAQQARIRIEWTAPQSTGAAEDTHNYVTDVWIPQ